MRKCAKYVLVTLLMFCFATSVKAEECSYEKKVDLAKQAASVKLTYEAVQIDADYTAFNEGIGQEVPVKEEGFRIKILNITKELSVTVSNSSNEGEKTYYYNDTENGTLTLGDFLADEVVTYTLKIEAYAEGCYGEDLLTNNFVVPRWNEYSEYTVCEDYPEYDFCQKYTTSTKNMTLVDFQKGIENYKKNHKSVTKIKQDEKKSFFNKIKDFFKKNKKVIVISVIALVIVGVATTTILIIRRRSRLI